MASLEEEPAPLSFWRAVGLTFEVALRNARTCVLLVSVYAVLVGVSTAIGLASDIDIDPSRANPGELAALLASVLAGLGAFALIATFVYPPTLGALSIVGEAGVTKDQLEAGGIVSRVFDRALEVIGAFVLTMLVGLIPFALVGLAGAAFGLLVGSEAALVAIVFTLLVLSVPAMYAVIRLALAVPVVITEGLGPVNALKRSWQLVGGSWWWVFGVLLLTGLGASILGSIVAAIVSAGTVGLGGSEDPNIVLLVIGNIVQSAVQGSILGVAIGVVYAVRAQVKPTASLELPEATPPAEAAQEES